MTGTFLGGSAGSWLGVRAYAWLGWPAVCALVAILAAAGLTRHLLHRSAGASAGPERRPESVPASRGVSADPH
jgi:hypothetical protein